MQRHLSLQIIAIILFIESITIVYFVSAEQASESMAEATFTCTFNNGAYLTIRAHMIVNTINVFDMIYDQQAIDNISATNPYIMGAIMLRLHDSLKKQVETVFNHADVQTMRTMPSYEKPYFLDEFEVRLTSSFFHHNGSLNLTELIPGFLDMGATITYHFYIQAEHGWNTTYTYVLPNTMTPTYANTADLDYRNNKITWSALNWKGNLSGNEATLRVQSKNPTSISSDTDDISLEYTLDTRTINDISFIDSILIKRANIHRYKVLPEFITGVESIPADGLRLCINNGLLSWNEFFENIIKPIEQETTPHIENSSFTQKLNLSFSWDAESTINCSIPYNITHMDDNPPIRANFKDSSVYLKICQIPARAFFGLINAGAAASISSADINLDTELTEIRYPYNIVLRLPSNISFNGDNVCIWNKTKPINGIFTSEVIPNPSYQTDHIETRIEIELLKIDLNIPSILTGKTELSASIKMKVEDSLYVISQTDELSLSPKINITYLNADAIRLCIEDNVFTDTQINSFLSQKTESANKKLSEIYPELSINNAIDKKLFFNSLVWDGDISTMDDLIPIIISNYANEVYNIGFNASLWPAEITLAPQRFNLHGMENQIVIYRIIFPRGVTINASESAGKSFIKGKTNDGRDYVELSFDEDSALQSTVLTCNLNVSPIYILELFLPCLLVCVLLIVLIVIIYLIRKKKGGFRRGKRKLFEPEDNEPSEYSSENYYVPPPPSTKKK